MKLPAILINITHEAAEKIYSGETNYCPCKQIPDLKGASGAMIYICEGMEVTGFAEYGGAKVSREEFTNSDKPGSVKAFKLKRAPEEWRWVKV